VLDKKAELREATANLKALGKTMSEKEGRNESTVLEKIQWTKDDKAKKELIANISKLEEQNKLRKDV
jgi:hypothetical protein